MAVTIDGTNGITNVNGSATTPAETGTDTDTGIYYGTNTVSLATGGTQRFTIDSSGNVGIGTSSPSTLLSLDKANVAYRGQLTLNGGSGGIAQATFYDGTTTQTNLVGQVYSGGADANAFNISAFKSVGVITFQTNANAERMRIDSSGNVLVGTTSASNSGSGTRMQIAYDGGGTQYGLGFRPTTNTTVPIQFGNASGSTVGTISQDASNVAYNTSSDYRLKENIAPMTGALAKIAALKPCTYNWKLDGSAGQGFIAHELAEVCPQAVTGNKDAVDKDGNPVYQGVDTSFLVATLTAAIQELKAEFDAYKAAHP